MKSRRSRIFAVLICMAVPGCVLGDCGGEPCAQEGETCGDGRACCDAEAVCDQGTEPAVCRLASFAPCLPGENCLTESGIPGVCAKAADGTFACFGLCGTIGDFCAAGRCYSSGHPFLFACMPEGSAGAGAACRAANDCAGGLPCLDAGKGGRCWMPCLADSYCGVGETCTDTGYGYSICFSPDRRNCAQRSESCQELSCCYGLVCDFESATCVPEASVVGDSCLDSSGCSTGFSCFDASGAFDPGYCTAACSADLDCVPEMGVACCNEGVCQLVGGSCGGREGGIGAGCSSGGGSDCQSGLYCEGLRGAGGLFEAGAFCTKSCSNDNDCGAPDLGCALNADTGAYVCATLPTVLCRACATDEDCGNPAEDFCVQTPNGERVCGTACDPFEPESCPANFECTSVLEDGGFRGFNCVPNGSCQ